MAQRSRARNWSFTIHSPENDLSHLRAKLEQLCQLRDGIRFFVAQIELTPTTNRFHIQGAIGFASPKALNSVKKHLGDKTAHLEISMGTPNDNYAYCTKTESRAPGCTPVEFGDFSVVQGSRIDLAELYRLSRKTHFLDQVGESHPEAAMRWQKAIVAVQKTAPLPLREKPQVWYIYGDTGVGKTSWVFQRHNSDDIYKLAADKRDAVWFDGYEGQPICLFDDWRSQRFPIDYMLQLLDRYPVRVPVKGGYVPFISSEIFITTNTAFDAVYPEETDAYTRRAFERRFDHIVEFTQSGVPRWIKGEPVVDNQLADPMIIQ